MKVANVKLVEIKKDTEGYIYIYVGVIKSFFKKTFIKITFSSKLPHYMWKEIVREIQSIMLDENKTIDDLIKKTTPTVLKIGKILFERFNESDITKYSTNIVHWQKLLEESIDRQMELESKYNEKYGTPKLY